MPKVSAAHVNQRKLILDEAAKLFWEKGYHETSIRDIAYACKFEASNLYYYFQKKEQILFDVVWQEIHQLINAIKHLEEDESISPIKRLESLVGIHVKQTLQNRKSSYRMLPDVEIRNLSPAHKRKVIDARDTYDRIVRRIISDGINSGDFAPMDEKMVGFAISSMIVRSRIWFSPKGKYSSGEIADIIFNLILNGLKSNKI